MSHGHTPTEPRCDHSDADCPPTNAEETKWNTR